MDNTATMSACNEFHRFPSLPSEIRLQIWRIALSIPRDVHIFNSGDTFSTFSHDQPPALLSICSESRREALKIYKLFFSPKSEYNFYVAFTQDTIIGSSDLYFSELQEVQKLKIKVNSTTCRFLYDNYTGLKMMEPVLRELEFIFEPGVMYGSMQEITNDIRVTTTQGWDFDPDIKIVDGKLGKYLSRFLDGRSVVVPITATIHPLLNPIVCVKGVPKRGKKKETTIRLTGDGSQISKWIKRKSKTITMTIRATSQLGIILGDFWVACWDNIHSILMLLTKFPLPVVVSFDDSHSRQLLINFAEVLLGEVVEVLSESFPQSIIHPVILLIDPIDGEIIRHCDALLVKAEVDSSGLRKGRAQVEALCRVKELVEVKK
ncbi:hypothetical protein B7494_g2757 [Chlorociboria aeruginascens]|nr:hypothetical protein B7494_g2757 [Chlorociboria aeruginascens]